MAIGLGKTLVYRDLSGLIPASLGGLEAVVVQVVHEQFELFVLNTYMNYYQLKHRLLAPLASWLAEFISRKPRAVFFLCGDFNCVKQPVAVPPISATIQFEHLSLRAPRYLHRIALRLGTLLTPPHRRAPLTLDN